MSRQATFPFPSAPFYFRIGFAYTPTLLHWFDMTNGRGRQLQEEVVKCVKNKK